MDEMKNQELDQIYEEVVRRWCAVSSDTHLIQKLISKDDYGTRVYAVGRYDKENKAVIIKVVRMFCFGTVTSVVDINTSIDSSFTFNYSEFIRHEREVTDYIINQKTIELVDYTKKIYELGHKNRL